MDKTEFKQWRDKYLSLFKLQTQFQTAKHAMNSTYLILEPYLVDPLPIGMLKIVGEKHKFKADLAIAIEALEKISKGTPGKSGHCSIQRSTEYSFKLEADKALAQIKDTDVSS